MSKMKRSQTRKSNKPLSRQNKLMLNKCSNTIKNRNADLSTLFNYADGLNQTGDVRGALKYYKKGLKRSPNDNAALINIALIFMGKSEFAEAIGYLIRAILYKPDQFLAYVYRSLAYMGEGKKAEAYQDFKFVYENYRDKIHHFTKLDVSKFPRIDIDEALEYCQFPIAVVRSWNVIYFPTVDCPVDEICLQKDYCQQKNVCPQNNMALLSDIILRKKLGHPMDYSGESVLLNIDDEMDSSETMLDEIESEMSKSLLSLSAKHLISRFRKSFHYFLRFRYQLTAIFGKVFLLLILPLNEIIVEYEVFIDF
jgi:tetratricopeptide (TPR) repeat protein